MPYFRLYSRELSLAEKRILAETLIAIALSAFRLRPDERHQITIQFMPRSMSPARFDQLFRKGEKTAVLEVSDHGLTVEKITAFVEAATRLLSESGAVKHRGRFARMLGWEMDPARQIAFQFNDTGSLAGSASASGLPEWAADRAA
jgi:hypothetical protein